MDEEQTPHEFELKAYWVDVEDGEMRDEPIAPTFRGSYADCECRARELLTDLAPRPLRWVTAIGVLPQLIVRIESA